MVDSCNIEAFNQQHLSRLDTPVYQTAHSHVVCSHFGPLLRDDCFVTLVLGVYSGLGVAAQQLNQTEMALLLKLLQGQTDLNLTQVAQLLNVSNPESLSQSLSALNEASHHQGAPEDQAQGPARLATQPPEPPPEPQELSPATGDPPLSQEDQASLLALILGHIIKPQAEGAEQGDESNGVQSEEAVMHGSSASTTVRKGKSEFSL